MNGETTTIQIARETKEFLDEIIDAGVVPISNRRITYDGAIRFLIDQYYKPEEKKNDV